MTKIQDKLSPQFNDLIKSLQFPDKFYEYIDNIIKEDVKKAKQEILDEFRKRLKKLIYNNIRMERFAYGQSYKKACDEMEEDINEGIDKIIGELKE